MALRDTLTPGMVTTPMFRVNGQKSRWRYPDPRMNPEDSILLTNVNLTERGTAQTRFGYTTFAATALAGAEPVVGFKQVNFPAHGLQQLVISPTKVYTDNGTTRKDISNVTFTGTINDYAQIVHLQNKAVINNGVDQIELWAGDFTSGTATVTLTGMPWSQADIIVGHRGALFVLATTESAVRHPTRIRWSDINRSTFEIDLTVWPTNNRTEIYEGGPPIVGAVDAWDKLWIFTESGVHTGQLVNDVGRLEFDFQDHFPGFSPIGRHSFVARPEFVFGASREGAFVFRRDGSFEIITENISDEWRTLNLGRLQYAQARIREKDHQVRLRVSSAANTVGHDKELVWDWVTGDVWFDTLTTVMNYCERVIVSNAELDFLGSAVGDLFKGNISTQFTDNGTQFPWRIKMQANDLGAPGKTKDIQFIRTYIRSKPSNQSIALSVQMDQGQAISRTTTLTGGSALVYNDGSLYNAALDYPGGTNERLDFWVNRQAKTFAPEWSGIDPVDIGGYDVVYRIIE
jgi:hypothetical protein